MSVSPLGQKFKDKATGKIFMAVNTHFDHVGEEARRQSALLIIRKIKEIVGERPAVVTGDFNVTDASDAYENNHHQRVCDEGCL